MIEHCGHCRRPLRWDESNSSVYIPYAGSCLACPTCYAAAVGQPPPEPRTYPPGSNLPKTPGGGDYPVCGLCRRALFGTDGGQTKPLRLRPEMPEVQDAGIEPGCYAACIECRERWTPAVYDYLLTYCRDRLPVDFTIRNCAGNWLA